MISDAVLATAIPSELKSDHPDSALVVQGIAIALAACENSGALTAKGRMKDVHAALKNVFAPIYTAHLTKEDEDWSALKTKAEQRYVVVNLSSAVTRESRMPINMPGRKAMTITEGYDSESNEWTVLKKGDDSYSAIVFGLPGDGDSPAMGATLMEALEAFYARHNLRVIYDTSLGTTMREGFPGGTAAEGTAPVPEPIQEPTQESASE